jgi:histidyl-tRNA synthetase
MKSQMKAADRSGATLVAIVGSQERDAGTVTLRPLRNGFEQQSQFEVPRGDVVQHVRKYL